MPFSAKFTILFSHQNALDMGFIAISRLVPYSIFLQCNVCLYDYSGYGIHMKGMYKGKYSEKDMYADIRGAFYELLRRYNVSASHYS